MALCELTMNDHVATLTLQREEAMNALSEVLLEEMLVHLQAIDQDETVRCVVITSGSERAFCAGADLKERRGMNEEQVRTAVTRIRSVIEAVAALKMPTIAAVRGVALGGGLELMLACDVRVVADTALLGLTETRLAIIPGAGGTQRLARIVGLGRAKELIFTGRRFTGTEAFSFGLAEYVVAVTDVLKTATAVAQQIGEGGPVALRAAKRAIQSGADVSLEEGLHIEMSAYEEVLGTQDRLEGLQAFAQKRKPQYTGQ
ncbi:Short-chain-enoyl-CoA hydratase [Acidibacillus sp. S0AB]|uniref:Short-chain-enoyl-CoA hydratase n=2 Tax=Sulfoacidibacillus ferrooxidans TaxID=2005001 RepID=A0A9X1V5N9_9BACL|nr:Short-chain-enoyl-CoA hydratase [Sulfoacidibacillus ferrooxidans]